MMLNIFFLKYLKITYSLLRKLLILICFCIVLGSSFIISGENPLSGIDLTTFNLFLIFFPLKILFLLIVRNSFENLSCSTSFKSNSVFIDI